MFAKPITQNIMKLLIYFRCENLGKIAYVADDELATQVWVES